MIQLLIDGEVCDLASTPKIPIDFSLDAMHSVSSERNGRQIRLSLPSTPHNDRIFNLSAQPYHSPLFNATRHSGALLLDGRVVLEGSVFLLSTTLSDKGNGYTIRLSEPSSEWARHAALTLLGATPLPLDIRLTPTEIAQTWVGDKAVRFLPVCRHKEDIALTSSLLPVERVLTSDHYHPFISVKEVVRSVFEEAGYTLSSRFLESELYSELLLSGSYEEGSDEEAERSMGFLARLSASATASADIVGRVFASPSVVSYSVGNIVNTTDPTTLDAEGSPMWECYNNGGCFAIDDNGYACFTANRSARVGFLLHVEYETDFRILSRYTLKGFDTIQNVGNTTVSFSLSNTYADYRGHLEGGRRYFAIVFSHTPGRSYRLVGGGTSLATFSQRSTHFVTPSLWAGDETTLLYRDEGEDEEHTYTDDWAIYNGIVEEVGRTKVVADIRLPSRECHKGDKILFNRIIFSGAEPDMVLTLTDGCSLRTAFSEVAGYGERLSFKDIAPRRMRQIDLLEAIFQMFNLVVYTDERAKTVLIEPEEEFFNGEEVDWSEKIDYSQPITISDKGPESPEIIALCYADGDKAVESFNSANEVEFGKWEWHNPLYAARKSKRVAKNPLFAPTLSEKNIIPTAKSAYIMRLEDSSPRIVRYFGLQPLPDGERWCGAQQQTTYPLAAYHIAGKDTTLCFEDRDGAVGLHRYYDEGLRRLGSRQTVTLSLQLSVADIAQLLSNEYPPISVRNRYRLKINGESSLYRLHSLSEFDPNSASTECTFIRLVEDQQPTHATNF